MSWTVTENPYQTFAEEAHRTPINVAFPQWTLEIWEKTRDFPKGRWYIERTASCLRAEAEVRIIFAPLDLARRDALPQMLELYQILGIPRDFTRERIQSVSHSFGQSTRRESKITWFHFLFKSITIKQEGANAPEVDNRAAAMGYHVSTLPQADYSYLRSGFFLREESNGRVTLVCFGAPPRVRHRIVEFIAGRSWEEVNSQPYILFDLIFDALYFEVDATVWNMNTVFGPLEHMILDFSNTKGAKKLTSKIPFAAMHNCAKHVVHMSEGLEACIMLVYATLANLENQDPTKDAWLSKQLGETLRYRRSLFRSSQLRITSLQKRIENAITLSFNIVTQQDSMVMIQDSNSMKIIAAITMIFLPTTGVATVVGSQLFLSQVAKDDDNSWEILTTPLFWIMWWIAIPLTVFVAILAMAWHWWTHQEHPAGEVVHVVKRAATFGQSGKKKV